MNRQEYVQRLHNTVREGMLAVVDREMGTAEVVHGLFASLGVVLTQVHLLAPEKFEEALNGMHQQLDAVALEVLLDQTGQRKEGQQKEQPKAKLYQIHPKQDNS